MQFTSLEMAGWLAHSRRTLLLNPLTVIAGPNGSGKSSARDAITFALTGDLCRVEAKGDRERLLTEGMDKGRVSLAMGETVAVRDVRTGKLAVPGAWPVPDTAVKGAVSYLTSPSAFAAVAPDDRRALLCELMRVDLSPAAMGEHLVARGHGAKLIGQLAGATVAEWHDGLKKRITETTGAWKQVTGEQYGSVKAEGWAAPVPAEPPAGLSGAEIASLERQRDSLNQGIGRIGGEAGVTDRAKQLRQVASLLPGVQHALESKKVAVGMAEDAEKRAADDLAQMEARLGSAYLDCPHCGAAVVVGADGKLQQHDPGGRPATEAQVQMARERHGETTRRVQMQRDNLAQLQADAGKGEAAVLALEAMGPDGLRGTGGQTNRDDLQRELDDVVRRLKEAEAAGQVQAQHKAACTAAEERTATAAGLHQRIRAMGALLADLAPSGIASELLFAALAPFNNTLRLHAVATGWPQVAIGADMTVTAAGRPYGLLSRSEQWRADVHLAVTIAGVSQLRFALVDEMDLLDVPSRKPALGWFLGLVKSGAMDSVLLFATMKEPLKTPPEVRSHWLGAAPATAQAA